MLASTSNPANFRKIAILGAGTMGHGIAQVCACAGYPSFVYDLQSKQIAAGLQRIRENLHKDIQKAKLSQADCEHALAHLHGEADFRRAVEGADLVIEAVPEQLFLKQEIFKRAAQFVSPQVILATNTSSISVAAIAQVVHNPERVVGTHFFNPVPRMKLLEIIQPEQCLVEVVEQIQAFAQRIGKEAIVVRDSPGFATSRLGLVIGLEAIRMVEENVASPEDIDKAMCLGYGFPMGPLRLTDLVGLDVRLKIAEYLSENLPHADHFKPPKLLQIMVQEGKLGKKSGQGFYSWPTSV